MWFGETPSSSIVCNGHLAALLMPISAYAGQAMAQWPPAPQAIMFGFTRWKGLIGSAHAPDWTCFTPVGLHRIKGSPSPPGTIIRTHTHTNTHTHTHTHTHTSWAHTAHRLLLNLMFSWLYICLAINTHTHTHCMNAHMKKQIQTHTHLQNRFIEQYGTSLRYSPSSCRDISVITLACTLALCKWLSGGSWLTSLGVSVV